MSGSDTSLGGPAGAFPATTWGLVSRFGADATRHRRDSLETLCRRYWKPVYRTLRITRAKSNDDAKDLTQAFFLWLTESETLRRYDPDLGSFRSYLKVLLARFAKDEEEALRRLKRGGGVAILPLDDSELAIGDTVPDPKALEPGRAFDRAWALETTRHAIDRVRARHAAGAKAARFKVFEAYDLAPAGDRPTYPQLAAAHGVSESEIGHILADVRAQVVEELRAELSDLTRDDREFEEEWHALFG